MALKIFGDNSEQAPAKKSTFENDIVARLRSGWQSGKTPVSLDEWRITSGDVHVLNTLRDLFGGDEPKKWDATGEDDHEIFTTSTTIPLILEGEYCLRESMVLYGRNGIIYASDGETISYPPERAGETDPQAGQSLADRKAAGRAGTGTVPKIEITGRIAQAPDLGKVKFQTGSWSMVSDLAYNDTADTIADLVADGHKVKATLTIERVEFTAKSGPKAGQVVSYNKPVLSVLGAL